MKQYLHPDIDKLFVVGDIHGNFKEFFHKIRINIKHEDYSIPQEELVDKSTMAKIEPFLDEDISSHIKAKFIDYGFNNKRFGKYSDFSNCVFIVAGDCGFGFNKLEYYHQIFNKYMPLLEQNNIFIYFVRGNHDDPSYFNEEKINYERIKTISDYSIIQVNSKNILCLGGAISIDRTWRKQEEFRINKYKKNKKQLYWENENIDYDQSKLDEIINQGIIINGIISHSTPHFAFPSSKDNIKDWARLDEKLYNDIKTERYALSNVFEYFKQKKNNIDFWCYGHYHVHNISTYENTTMYAINEMQFTSIPLVEGKKDSIDSPFDWDVVLDEIPNHQGNAEENNVERLRQHIAHFRENIIPIHNEEQENIAIDYELF